ncbi:MAG: hypothetical protein ACT4OJ_05630, partial [Bacteroidota bacterium]
FAFCLLPFGFCLLPSVSLYSQQFGGNPPSLKWKQIHTDTASIIYPAGMDSSANRVAFVVHYLASQQPYSLGKQLKKINIVLQNQTVIANGYVGLGPYRSEFFLTPEMNNFGQGSIPWTDQLAVHEYRHVQQINNFSNGLSKLMKVISGEQGYDLAINAAIPNWFYEGDAVYVETALTNQGRGRLPQFMNAFPALWQAGKKYSWMKLRNGSLKDYVPNHYYLGYLLVNYGREKYGADFWTKVTKDASAYKSLFYPFQAAVKKHAGVDYKTFREQAMESYKTTLRQAQGDREASRRSDFVFPVQKNYVTNYFFPYAAGSDSLIYLKTDYRHRPAFMLKDKNGERRIRVRDISVDEQFSYRNGKIVYAAYESDLRWSWKDYSVIRILDVVTGQQQTLAHKTKYFTPDISPDGNKVAAIQVNPGGHSAIHILDANDGHVLDSVVQPAGLSLITDPKFIDNNILLASVRHYDGKMSLAITDISVGRHLVMLTSPSFNVIGYPCFSNGVVYFTASYGGNDHVFGLRMSDRKIFRISNGLLGNYFVNAANGKITWSAFTAEGYQLKQVNENDIEWKEINVASTEILTEKHSVSKTGGAGDILQFINIPPRSFSADKYKKGTKLLNFHSWRPYYSDPVFTYSIYGENVLNTLQSELFYAYNQNDKTNSTGFFTTYGALFPYFTGGVEYTFDNETPVGNRIRQWGQLDTRVGLNIPLSYASGQTYKNFSAGSYYILRNEFNKDFYKDSLGNSSFSYLLHTLSWTQQVQRSVQHIYPRFAYSVLANHRHAITDVSGYQFIGSGALYVPGILSTHNLVLTGSFQQRDTLGQIVFSNRFAYARGYEGRYFSRMWRLSANYHFPLLYPDWGFGNILYLQRIRANAFYDFAKVYSRDKTQTRDQRSAGGEIFIDTKWWNQYPLTFGFRISRLLDPDQFDGFQGTRFEFVLPVSIIPR